MKQPSTYLMSVLIVLIGAASYGILSPIIKLAYSTWKMDDARDNRHIQPVYDNYILQFIITKVGCFFLDSLAFSVHVDYDFIRVFMAEKMADAAASSRYRHCDDRYIAWHDVQLNEWKVWRSQGECIRGTPCAFSAQGGSASIC